MREKTFIFFLFFLALAITGQSLLGQTYSLDDIRVNQPKNFTATSDGSTITLSWDWDSNISTTGFRVYRSETGGEPFVRPTNGKIFDPNARSFTDIDALTTNQDYYYIIQPFEEPGDLRGLESLKIVIQLGDSQSHFPNNIQGPTNLTATRVGNDVQLAWDWDPQGLDIEGFKFERAVNYGSFNADFSPRLVSNPDARTFTDTDVGPGVYVYRCFAYNSSMNYTFSETTAILVSDGVSNELTVSPSNRDVSNLSGSTTFEVTSNVSWSVSDDAAWLSVSPTSGSNNGTLTVNFDSNDTSSDRIGTVTISGGGITSDVTVTQLGGGTNQLLVDPSNRNVTNSPGSTTFNVTSNVSWSVSDDATWLSVSPTSGSNNGTLTVNYDTNGTGSERIATVTVSDGDIIRNVTITQSAEAASQLVVDPASRNVSSPSGSTTFDVTSNVSWSAGVDASWLSVSPASGSNDATLTVNYEANSSSSERTGTVTVSGDGITRNVTVTQSISTDNLDLNDIRANQPKNFDVSTVGSSVTLTWDWNPNSTISGFKIYRSPDGQDPWTRPTGGKFYNPDARSFVDNQDNLQPGDKYHYLVQAFLEPPGDNSIISLEKQIIVGEGEPSGLVPNPQNFTATITGGTITLNWDYDTNTVISGFKLERQDNFGSWVRPTGGKIADPNARTFSDETASANGIYAYRVFAYLASGGDQNYPYSETVVIHKGSDIYNLDVDPLNRNVSSQADSTTFDITSNVSWTLSDDSEWLNVVPSNGYNNTRFTVSYNSNSQNEDRVGTITINGAGITKTVTVSQSRLEQLDVTPSNHDVGNQADSTTVIVTSNISWSVIDNAEWITVRPDSGSNDDTLTVIYDANGSLSSRMGTISVTGGGITRTTTISQAALSQLTVTPTNQDVGNTADSTFFEVISNTSWTITDDADWLTVIPSNGINSVTVSVHFDANNTTEQRMATVTVTGGGLTKTVTVTQDMAVGIKDLESLNDIPTEYNLFSNYPNPFNPSTVIEFAIPEESTSQLKIYDILGKEIAVILNNETVAAGNYRYNFNADEFPSGIYIYVLTAQSNNSGKSFRSVRKMMLLK